MSGEIMRLPVWGIVAAALLYEAPPAVAQSPLYDPTPLADQIEQRLQTHGAQTPSAPNPNKVSESEVQTLIERIMECWEVPKSVRNHQNLRVTVQLKLTKDGSLAEPPKVLNSNRDPRFAVAVRSAIAGVKRCAPFSSLPAAKYDDWKDIIIDFDPTDLPRP